MRSSLTFAVFAILLLAVFPTPSTHAAPPAEPPAQQLAGPLIPPPPFPPIPAGPEIVAAAAAREASFEVFDDGSYVVVWRPENEVSLRARLYAADDEPIGAPFEVGSVTAEPRVAYQGGWAVETMDGDDWAVAWTQRACDDCPSAVYLSTYDGATPVAERELVAGGETDRFGPALAWDGESRLAVGWTLDNAVPQPAMDGENFTDVFARVYVSGAGGPTFRVNEIEYEEQLLRGAVYLHTGDLVFVWESYEGEGSFYDVETRRFGPDGQPLGGEARVHEDQNISQFAPSIAATDFGYWVTWTDWSYTLGFDGAIVGRSFNAEGVAAGGELLISEMQPAANRDGSSVAAAADGSFVVLWTATCPVEECTDDPDGPDGSRGGVYGRAFAPDWQFGNDSGEIGVPLQTAGAQGAVAVRAASFDGYLSLWLSQPAAGGPTRVVLRRLRPVGSDTPCSGLCLGGERFQVLVQWKDFQGHGGEGVPVQRGDDWGTFWFFRPDNVELAVKVLDGTAINGHFWVFYASLSNVEYSLLVVDRVTHQRRIYVNPAGRFASRGDTLALPQPPEGAPSILAPRLAPPAHSRAALAGPAAAPLTIAPCTAPELCLHGDRFAVEIDWHDPFGGSGEGVGAQLTADSGWFWFFRPGNPEVLVKVLDGRPVNGHFWVFYAALSNVGFTLRVTDRLAEETVSYDNPLGTFASRGDTTAFADP